MNHHPSPEDLQEFALNRYNFSHLQHAETLAHVGMCEKCNLIVEEERTLNHKPGELAPTELAPHPSLDRLEWVSFEKRDPSNEEQNYVLEHVQSCQTCSAEVKASVLAWILAAP
ncbi:MAG: hypothetical protein HC801_13660 [Nitrospira sp.]|nr:hypothetical protein [Nitrospira sp.]